MTLRAELIYNISLPFSVFCRHLCKLKNAYLGQTNMTYF